MFSTFHSLARLPGTASTSFPGARILIWEVGMTEWPGGSEEGSQVGPVAQTVVLPPEAPSVIRMTALQSSNILCQLCPLLQTCSPSNVPTF